MTNELEKQFFDTFGIEPKCETRAEHRKHECYGMVDCDECASAIYPQITDTHYLKLICIISQKWDSFVILRGFNLDEFKREILLGLIRTKNEFYNQVCTLFEEG